MPGLSSKKSARSRPAAGASDGAPPVPEPRPGRPRGRRLPAAAILAAALALLLPAFPPAAPAKAKAAAKPAPRSPVAVIAAFDSLLGAGDLPAARALCAGQVLRMFDFLAMAHSRMAGAVDSARSREDTLADSVYGDWAWVKMRSHVVFRRPFLGQTELKSVQAVHLWRSPRGWVIAEFQELERPEDPIAPRTGRPLEAAAATATASAALPGDTARPAAAAGSQAFFPVSPTAPRRAGEADRLRYRLRLRNGAPLAAVCALDSAQRLVQELSPSEWILENRLPRPSRDRKAAAARASAARGAAAVDSLKPYLASNAYLVLEDSLLRAAARKAVRGARDPAVAAHRVRAWVTQGFRFRLGAVLFGNSREVLRDMTGDCSEAAILAAALLRASGVPARVALGFASAGRGVFIGHAWTEAWLGPRAGWVGVDAALGQYPAGVERVKLVHLDGSADMRIAATNLMLSALSNLDIEILEASKGGRDLPLTVHPGAAEEGAEFFSEILKGFEKN